MIGSAIVAVLVVGIVCWLAESLIPPIMPRRIVQAVITLAVLASLFGVRQHLL